MLKQFQAILQRESLKDDLDSKFMVIFHNYGLDLETVQRLYEKQKHAPPHVRNAPPVTGNILWSRQLMRRIEEPMGKFQANQNLMTTKESKKIVKTYNRIARTIVEFETLWHMAWTKSIDASKAGLQATLIIRHPSNGKLYVNFDREIMQLIRETKCLLRIGVEVPESAKMVLMQEDKFKSYYNKLAYALEQYDAVVEKLLPITAPLLKPHLQDMERKIQPGMVTLTWTSMNIDGFLHRIHSGLGKLDLLAEQISDLVTNRIERNLKAVSRMSLVDLPKDESLSLDRFIGLQEKHIKEQASAMEAKNLEIEEAVADLLELITAYQLEAGISHAPEEEQAKLREHYGKLMYRAVLNATKSSLAHIKKRIGSRASGGECSAAPPTTTTSPTPSPSTSPSRLPLHRAPLLRRRRRAHDPVGLDDAVPRRHPGGDQPVQPRDPRLQPPAALLGAPRGARAREDDLRGHRARQGDCQDGAVAHRRLRGRQARGDVVPRDVHELRVAVDRRQEHAVQGVHEERAHVGGLRQGAQAVRRRRDREGGSPPPPSSDSPLRPPSLHHRYVAVETEIEKIPVT